MQLIEDIRAGRATPPSGITTLRLDRAHHWLTEVAPGVVTMVMPFDDAHLNLEDALICSWLIAVADQAMFFASNSACAEGEMTRMQSLRFETMANITSGDVTFVAKVDERVDEVMHCSCVIRASDGSTAATVEASIAVIS
jgi:acyl-coenzyme A thioesterase PaaI-like protein